MKPKMKTKKLIGLFVAMVSLLLLATSIVSAGTLTTISSNNVEIDGVQANSASVVAGELVTVSVEFTADEDDTEVTVEAEMEVNGEEKSIVSDIFDVEANNTYEKVLTLRVPFDLDDEVSDDASLDIEIQGKDHDAERTFELNVQRPTFNAVLKSVIIPQNAGAGESLPVDIVTKNVGYNDLDDIFVTATIPALGVTKTGYLGDLVALENCSDDCDNDDTVMARLYLSVPYTAQSGVYSVEVTVENDDTTSEIVKQFTLRNEIENRVIVTDSKENVAINEEAEYEILLVNPTNTLKVYTLSVNSDSEVSTDLSESVIAVPAGSSRKLVVNAEAEKSGNYEIAVDVLSGKTLEGTASLQLEAEGSNVANPVVILTVVLAIIFAVLLVVLIVLVTKKPEKTEEFGESYY